MRTEQTRMQHGLIVNSIYSGPNGISLKIPRMPSQCMNAVSRIERQKRGKGNNMVLTEEARRWNSMDFIPHPPMLQPPNRMDTFDQMDLKYGVNALPFFIALYTKK